MTLNAYKPLQLDDLKRRIISIDSLSGEGETVLSCYLNTQQGRQACHQFIDDHAGQIMKSGSTNSGLSIDGAIRLIHQLVDQDWHNLTRGLAIFINCRQEQANHELIALPAAVSNQLSVYRSANILPLQRLLNTLENMTLLLLNDGVIQLHEIGPGYLKPLAWATAPQLEFYSDLKQGETGSSSAHRQLRLVRQSMLKRSGKPLLIAAQSASIDTVKAWLPKAIACKLMDTITLPYDLDQAQVNRYIQNQVNQVKFLQSRSIISNVKNSLQHKGHARVGVASTLDALKNLPIECLIIAENHEYPSLWKCTHCATFYNSLHHSAACSSCRHSKLQSADPVIEASWLAFHNRIPVITVDSDELRYMGGMACLLSQRQHSSILALTTQVPVKHLERVA